MKPGFVTRRRARRRGEDGAAAVEFALVLIPFLLLIFGAIQYGMYFFAAQTGSHAANSAIRQLSVGKCTDSADLLAFVNKELGSSAVAGSTTVSTSYVNEDGTTPPAPQAQNVNVGGQVTLIVAFNSKDLNFPLLPFLDDGKIARTVDARVEFVPQSGCGA